MNLATVIRLLATGGLSAIGYVMIQPPITHGGNGSAMRVSAVGLVAKTLDECLRLAKQTAAVSHNHPEAIKGAQAAAASIFIALHWTGEIDELKYT